MLQYLKDYRIAWWVAFYLATGMFLNELYRSQKEELLHIKTCWGVRYYKHTVDSCGHNTFIVNSTDEGYTYKTRKEALEAGYSAVKSDVEVGYVIDSTHRPVVTPFKCLCDE